MVPYTRVGTDGIRASVSCQASCNAATRHSRPPPQHQPRATEHPGAARRHPFRLPLLGLDHHHDAEAFRMRFASSATRFTEPMHLSPVVFAAASFIFAFITATVTDDKGARESSAADIAKMTTTRSALCNRGYRPSGTPADSDLACGLSLSGNGTSSPRIPSPVPSSHRPNCGFRRTAGDPGFASSAQSSTNAPQG
jgi:hypothetical protein